jgi:hypothetical protein
MYRNSPCAKAPVLGTKNKYIPTRAAIMNTTENNCSNLFFDFFPLDFVAILDIKYRLQDKESTHGMSRAQKKPTGFVGFFLFNSIKIIFVLALFVLDLFVR